MNFFVSSSGKDPLYKQIVNHIKRLIYEKSLVSNEQLPSVRKLASELGVGVITTKRAYDELVKLNLIVSKEAVGYFVSSIDVDKLLNLKQADIKEVLKDNLLSAKKIKITKEEVIKLIKDVYEDEWN